MKEEYISFISISFFVIILCVSFLCVISIKHCDINYIRFFFNFVVWILVARAEWCYELHD